jgi:hypothetical protein
LPIRLLGVSGGARLEGSVAFDVHTMRYTSPSVRDDFDVDGHLYAAVRCYRRSTN